MSGASRKHSFALFLSLHPHTLSSLGNSWECQTNPNSVTNHRFDSVSGREMSRHFTLGLVRNYCLLKILFFSKGNNLISSVKMCLCVLRKVVSPNSDDKILCPRATVVEKLEACLRCSVASVAKYHERNSNFPAFSFDSRSPPFYQSSSSSSSSSPVSWP